MTLICTTWTYLTLLIVPALNDRNGAEAPPNLDPRLPAYSCSLVCLKHYYSEFNFAQYLQLARVWRIFYFRLTWSVIILINNQLVNTQLPWILLNNHCAILLVIYSNILFLVVIYCQSFDNVCDAGYRQCYLIIPWYVISDCVKNAPFILTQEVSRSYELKQ